MSLLIERVRLSLVQTFSSRKLHVYFKWVR